MSLLTIVAGAASSLSLPTITAVVGSLDANATLLFTLAKREGRELMRRHDWQNLVVAHTWTTTATVAQSSALPSDYDRLVPDVEIWNRSANSRLVGPTPSNTWQRLQSGISGGVTGWWRIIGNVLQVYPAPEASQTFALDYISKNYCESSGGTDQAEWAADADLGRIPEHLVELGLVWRWLRAKGMDYAEELATYEREVEKAASRDRGLGTAVIIGGSSQDITEPFWPGTVTEV
jgi:hypothetical protein